LNILQRIWLSVFPGNRKAAHEQNSNRKIFRSFALHFRPAEVPERTLRLSLTWGLGGMAAVLVFLLLSTGLMIKFTYAPFPDRAYDSIVFLNNQVPFGQLLRNIHRWSANGLLLVVFLHYLRVFYTGAFTAPRQFNWIIGLILFIAVVFSNFTGYLLPWDQIAYWAITISTSMLDYIPVVGTGLKEWILGGTEPGAQTLMNFYAIHTAILPALLLFFLPFHFWRIRKTKGLVIPRSPEEDLSTGPEMAETMPHLIKREVAIALVVLATVLIIAMFVDAPLAEKANPGLSPNPTKAPWYFMGIQEMLMHFHPVVALLIIPALLVWGLLSIPYINYEADTAGDEYVIPASRPGPADIFSTGLLPFTIIVAACAGFYYLVKKGFDANNNEAIQALFTLLTTAIVVLTIIGTWFRGTGMQLMWSG
jgi:quinol-cytochrome oxidoreductase complex cytochrome b subunit